MAVDEISKTFCILEQGNLINDPITIKHKEQFNTEFSDFYRLNWGTDKDPNADFYSKGVTLSEGKNLLYEKVPKIYKYYIFIDDDMLFSTTDEKPVAEKIKELLDKYNPLHGTFYRETGTKWGNWHVTHVAKQHAQHNRQAWPIYGFDLDCDIYHWSYIRAVLPIKYHGCYKCLGYTQYICYKLHQNKQLMMDGVRLNNTRKGNHKNELALPQANNGLTITKLFLKDLLENPLNKNAQYVLNNSSMIPKLNSQIYLNKVNSEEIIFDPEDLKKICKC